MDKINTQMYNHNNKTLILVYWGDGVCHILEH